MPAMGARTTGVATSTVPPEGAVRRSGGYVGTVVESTGPGDLPCMADPPTLPPAPRRIEWRLDDLDLERAGRWSLVASGVAMAGCVVLAFRHLQAGAVDWSAPGVALGVTLVIVGSALSLVIHEAAHGLVIALCGVRPVFGWGKMGGAVPFLYAGAPGHRFTRGQFLAVGWAPTVLVNAMLLWLVAAFPWGVWLVIPTVVHVSGCVGDWMMMTVLGRQPRGTVVEDTREGMTLHLP